MCCSSTRVEYAGCLKYTAVSPRCTTLSTPAIWSYRSVSGVGPPTRFAEEQRLESTLRGIGIAEVVGGRTIRHFGQQSYRFRALFCLSALHHEEFVGSAGTGRVPPQKPLYSVLFSQKRQITFRESEGAPPSWLVGSFVWPNPPG